MTGGAALTLCDAPDDRGGSWADDDTIAFAAGNRGPLLRVSAAGGKPEPLTTLAEGETAQRWPQLLPGGKGVLYTSGNSDQISAPATIVVVLNWTEELKQRVPTK